MDLNLVPVMIHMIHFFGKNFFFFFRIEVWLICFPGGSDGKESACNTEDVGSVPGAGRFPGEGTGNLLLCSCLENRMDTGARGLQTVGSHRVRHNFKEQQQQHS